MDPTVLVDRWPGDGDTGVARNALIRLWFTGSVSGASGATLKLRDVASDGTISATVGYDPLSASAVISTVVAPSGGPRRPRRASWPASRRRPGSPYPDDLDVPGDGRCVRSTRGGPRIPRAGASGVSRWTSVTVRFSEPVAGVSRTTFRLRDAVTGRYVTAVVRYSASTRTATLDPSTGLRAGRRYVASLTRLVADTAGNPLAAQIWSLTTGVDCAQRGREVGQGRHVRDGEVRRRRGGRRGAAARPVVAAVHPDRGQAQLLRRDVVVEEALGDVEDPLPGHARSARRRPRSCARLGL